MKVGRRGADGSPAGGAAFPGLRRAAYLREGSHNSHLTVLRQCNAAIASMSKINENLLSQLGMDSCFFFRYNIL